MTLPHLGEYDVDAPVFLQWIYFSDDHLYAKRWESLMEIRDQVDVVQHLTWNDYGESHYIGPIEGAQPNSQAWVDGFDHTGKLC